MLGESIILGLYQNKSLQSFYFLIIKRTVGLSSVSHDYCTDVISRPGVKIRKDKKVKFRSFSGSIL